MSGCRIISGGFPPETHVEWVPHSKRGCCRFETGQGVREVHARGINRVYLLLYKSDNEKKIQHDRTMESEAANASHGLFPRNASNGERGNG